MQNKHPLVAIAPLASLLILSPAHATNVVFNVSGSVASGDRTITLDADGSTRSVVDPFVITGLSDVSLDLTSFLTTVTLASGASLTLQPITFGSVHLSTYSFTGLTLGTGRLVGTFKDVATGSYLIAVGSSASAGGGVYSGTVTLSAVPEPLSGGLALAGLVVLRMRGQHRRA
jgi:hypothetical protein